MLPFFVERNDDKEGKLSFWIKFFCRQIRLQYVIIKNFKFYYIEQIFKNILTTNGDFPSANELSKNINILDLSIMFYYRSLELGIK